MNLHLAEIARTVAPGAHAVLVLDGAGWHGGKELAVPDNISLLTLPPYAPELNPVENVWEYLRGNGLSNTSSTATSTSSKPVAKLGTSSSKTKPKLLQQPPVVGQRTVFRAVGITGYTPDSCSREVRRISGSRERFRLMCRSRQCKATCA
jgi:hypothetical protein